MRRGRPRIAPIALLLAASSLAAAGRARAPLAWTRLDLTLLDPVGGRPTSASAEWKLGILEAENAQGATGNGGAAPTLRAIRQHVGTTLAWRVALGEQPVVSFIPLRGSNPACVDVGSIDVASASAKPTRVWQGGPQPAWPDAHEVVVALDRWRGQTVELRFTIAGGVSHRGRPCALMWASPEVLSRQPAPARVPHPAQPNIVLIGADTLRADALGAWGRHPSVTPTLDALAAESDAWLDAFSTANSTNTSFASIHTGLYASHHGVHDLKTALLPGRATLAELLATRGYETRAILAAPHLAHTGMPQRFASMQVPSSVSSARLAVGDAIDWLQRPRERPFFLWLHVYDPHTPHMPPAPYSLGQRAGGVYGLAPVGAWTAFRSVGPRAFRETELGGNTELYAGEVAYLDRELDRLLGTLAERGYLDDTIVVFVADHGENLEEHGIRYRHAGLWDTTTHVPMLIRWPGATRAGRRIHGLAQTIDLFPTLLAAAGVPAARVDGVDLRRLFDGRRAGRPAVYAEQVDGKGASVRTGAWRYFLSAGSPFVKDGVYVYDLARDPGETTNVAGRQPAQEAELRRLLDAWRKESASGKPGKLTAEEAAALKALGYGT